MSDLRKTQTLKSNAANDKVNEILNWKKTFDLKVVLMTLFWFAFMTCWMVLLVNHGEVFLKHCIPAFLILSFILIMRTIENLNK